MAQKYAGGAVTVKLNRTMTAGSPGVDGTFSSKTTPTGWPTLTAGAGNTAVCQIDSEKILIKAIAGSIFTVSQRGFDGTTAASHADDANIIHLGDAASFQRFSDHIDDPTAAHAASAISYAGAVGIAATDVEAALDELATEKLDTTAAKTTATFYTDHTWAIPYPAVESGATDFIIPMRVWVVAGEVKELEAVRYQIGSGTSVTFSFCKGATFSNTTAATGYSGLSATTANGSTNAANVALADGDYLRPDISAVSGTPENLMVIAVIKHVVTLT